MHARTAHLRRHPAHTRAPPPLPAVPALVYGEVILALVLDQVAGRRWMPLAAIATVAVAGVGHFIFAPWVYAFPLSADSHAARRWLSRWD